MKAIELTDAQRRMIINALEAWNEDCFEWMEEGASDVEVLNLTDEVEIRECIIDLLDDDRLWIDKTPLKLLQGGKS